MMSGPCLRTFLRVFSSRTLLSFHPSLRPPKLSTLAVQKDKGAVTSQYGLVSCNVPQAASAGLEILERGGNAADSAVAMAAALNVTEPMSTGLGGDCYCLFYRASDGAVLGINGSGRTPAALTRSRIPPEGLPPTHGLTVTVPGAAAGWVDTVERFGSQQLALSEILAPAVRLAKNGYKVTPLVSRLWSKNCQGLPAGTDLLPKSGKPPVEGERVTMPNLARTLTELGEHGKDGFFKGRVAEAIVAAVKEAGGCLGLVDLAATADDPHFTDMEPVSAKFDGLTVWESSANSQGVVALLALRLLEHHLPRLSGLEHNSPEYVAILTRCFHLAFQQGLSHVTSDTSTRSLLSLLQADSVEHLLHQAITPLPAIPTSSDTTYITALDAQGNACSFINSIFTPFGSKIVPRDCGFALHNRGLFFSLDPRWSPNTYSPRSRPYHTLTPGLVTQGDGQLVASLGTMGGFMQPQAHVQYLLNMKLFGMDPHQALAAPRICLEPASTRHLRPMNLPAVYLEHPNPQVAHHLTTQLGYRIKEDVPDGERFGRGHLIARRTLWDSSSPDGLQWWAAADPRSDGHSLAVRINTVHT